MKSAQEKYTSSLRASDELIGAVKGKRVFSTADHIQEVKGERRDKKKQDTTNDAKLKIIVSYQVAFENLIFLDDKHTGASLILRGITVNDTVLAATQFSDFYEIVTMLSPPI